MLNFLFKYSQSMVLYIYAIYMSSLTLIKHKAGDIMMNNITSFFKKIFNKKEAFTIMVVPHAPVKNTKSIRFTKRFISIFAVINFIMFTVVCLFAISYHSLNIKLQNKKAEYESLQAVKENDEKKLNDYKAQEKEIQEKIQVIIELENKLKKIIESNGSIPQSNIDSKEFKIASRGMGGPDSNTPSDLNIPLSIFDDPETFYESVDKLELIVNESISDLNKAIEKAEIHIKELRAIPSVFPTYGNISSPFGYRRLNGRYEFHSGVDISNSRGTPIRASADGKVTIAGWNGGYGILVKINHGNGYESLYGHNSKVVVNVGQEVKRGDIIAYMGSTGRSTGPHCHFEVRYNNSPINPFTIKAK